ncbi:MAG: FIST C-terminal domain-containing protein [Candidatus Omnitrophica bacterium]|nr:FIST C-terminal domain-containing protein [Candidatus Omnitrophota bacterium]
MAAQVVAATVGWSANRQAAQAGTEAASRALERLLPFAPPQLALVFGSSWFDQRALLQGVRSVLGELPLAGESTAGEITAEGPASHSCVVVLLAIDGLACGVGMGRDADRAPRVAGQRAAFTALQAFRGSPRAGLLLLGDGMVTGYAEVVRGLQEVLGTSFLIAGGMAGDDLRFAETYQYCHGEVASRSVVGVLLGGSARLGVGLEHGFAPISKPRRITRASANVLLTLDRKPAASVYEEYFGVDVVRRMREEGLNRQGIAYPLGIQGESANQWLLRNVVSFGDDGSLACNGEMREGAWLQLMIGSRELALEAAQRAARQAIRPLNRIACVLVFDSAVRRALLGPHHAAMEIERIRGAVGPSVPLAGCYTYAEQAPFDAGLSADGLTGQPIATQTGSVLVAAIGV